MVYPALLTLMRTPRLSAFDWTDAPADLNGLVRFGERRNLVSARVPSRFKRNLPIPPTPTESIYVFCLVSEQNMIISQYNFKGFVFITDT